MVTKTKSKTKTKTEKLNKKSTAKASKPLPIADSLESEVQKADQGRARVVEVTKEIIEKRNGKSRTTNGAKHNKIQQVMKPILDSSFYLGNAVDLKLFKMLKTAFNEALKLFPIGSEMQFVRTLPIVLNFHFGRFPNQGYRRVLKAYRTPTQRSLSQIKQSFIETNNLDMIAKSELDLLEMEIAKHNGLHSIDDVLEFDVEVFRHWLIPTDSENELHENLKDLYSKSNLWFGNAVANLINDILPSFSHLQEHHDVFGDKTKNITQSESKGMFYNDKANTVLEHLGLQTIEETRPRIDGKDGKRNVKVMVKLDGSTQSEFIKEIVEQNDLDLFNSKSKDGIKVTTISINEPSEVSQAETMAIRCQVDTHFTGIIKVIDSNGNQIVDKDDLIESEPTIKDAKYGSCYCGYPLVPNDSEIDQDYQIIVAE